MNSSIRVREVLQKLGEMPLLNSEELSAVASIPERTARDVLCRLQDEALVDSIRHSCSATSRMPRWCLSQKGIDELATLRWQDETPEDLLDLFPVSAEWRRYLLRRLDAVGVLYRVAQDAAIHYYGEISWSWERRGPIDAVLQLPGNRTVGLMRIGTSLSWKAIASRCGTLVNMFRRRHLQAVLMLVPGPIDIQRVRHLMSRHDVNLAIATETDVLQTPARFTHMATACRRLSSSAGPSAEANTARKDSCNAATDAAQRLDARRRTCRRHERSRCSLRRPQHTLTGHPQVALRFPSDSSASGRADAGRQRRSCKTRDWTPVTIGADPSHSNR